MRAGFVLAVVLQATPQADEAARIVSRLTPAEVEAGRKLFAVHCANCHGVDGRGGRGPSLALPKLRQVTDDKSLFDAIGDGLPGTEMPAIWQLSDAERWRVVGYVRALGRVPPEPVAGDVVKGRALYQKSGCGACHVVRGEGGTQGPDLTEIGQQRGAAYLRQALTEPTAAAPDGFLLVRARTRDGREIEGMRLAEDTFTIQLRDLADRLHSFRKDELAALTREAGRSTMPSYRELLPADGIEDLVAYMAGLGREP